jgi:hypothetical protein
MVCPGRREAWVGEFDPQMSRFVAKLTGALELVPVS